MRYDAIPWTEGMDKILIEGYSKMTFREIAARLCLSWQNVQTRCNKLIKAGRLDPRTRFYQPRWTRIEIDYLKENFGLVTDAWIARRLRRSQVGIRLKAKRVGLIKKMNLHTQREFARIFGVDDKTVRRWIYLGALGARKGAFRQGSSLIWRIDGEDVEAFIKGHPELYESKDIDREQYPYYRALADRYAFDAPGGGGAYRRRQRQYSRLEDDFIIMQWTALPSKEIARRLGRPYKSVGARVRKFLRKEGYLLPDKRVPPYRNHLVKNRWAPDQDDYLRRNWGLLPDDDVAFVVGHTASACEARAWKLGVRRTDNRKAAGITKRAPRGEGLYGKGLRKRAARKGRSYVADDIGEAA